MPHSSLNPETDIALSRPAPHHQSRYPKILERINNLLSVPPSAGLITHTMPVKINSLTISEMITMDELVHPNSLCIPHIYTLLFQFYSRNHLLHLP
ncbi:MAG TPA: hypothetical protein PLJ10_04235 [Candidatus Hydrogenedens sp.]|nr:hypothetical protein [Candidatus Hydrogenedens sp.]HOL18661.1 hypothetical protein [Candidatus Hydrogenedens sp.]